VAAIVPLGDLTNKRKKVNRRQVDNLPSHVKGQAYFEDYSRTGGSLNKSTGYYIDRPNQKHCTVEFIEVDGEDYWTALHWNNIEEFWYTARPALIPRNNKWNIGWWSLDDPQHPNYIDPEQFAETSEGPHLPTEAHPGPHKEILTGGLHHIATLQGASPLSPQEPILPQIEEAIAQGISIPLDITPVAAVLPPFTQGPPIIPIPVATSAQGNTLSYVPMSGSQPIQVAASGGQTITVTAASNGGLKGTPPQPFKGDRNKSHAFLVAFGIFRFANQKNKAMSNPATWVTTALTYMQENMIEPWKEEQMTKLKARINRGVADTEEIHWTEFEQAFKDSFTNANRKQEAFNSLIKLKHGPDGLDIFIAEFKQLATAAEVQLNDHGMIYHFKQGLKSGLMQAIIASNAYTPQKPWTTFKEWEDNAHSCHLKWIHSQEFKKQNDNRQQGLYQALRIKPKNANQQGRRTTAQGGNAMDIDTICGPELLDKQKAKLMTNRACFYCFKVGHQAKECHKKLADHAKSSGRPAGKPIQAQGQNSAIPLDMTPSDIAQFLKDNVDTINDETKVSIVEKILPTGFLTGPN